MDFYYSATGKNLLYDFFVGSVVGREFNPLASSDQSEYGASRDVMFRICIDLRDKILRKM